MPELTQAKLKYYLTYNKFDGVFYWNDVFASKYKNGKIAGCYGKYKKQGVNGENSSFKHPTITIERRAYSIGKLAWLYEYGEFPKNLLRRKNGDVFDNRIENLEESTQSIITLSIKKKSVRCKSKLRGVSFCNLTKKFKAEMRINRERTYLGLFVTEQEAHQAYLDAKAKHLQTQKLDGIGN